VVVGVNVSSLIRAKALSVPGKGIRSPPDNVTAALNAAVMNTALTNQPAHAVSFGNPDTRFPPKSCLHFTEGPALDTLTAA